MKKTKESGVVLKNDCRDMAVRLVQGPRLRAGCGRCAADGERGIPGTVGLPGAPAGMVARIPGGRRPAGGGGAPRRLGHRGPRLLSAGAARARPARATPPRKAAAAGGPTAWI